MKLLRSRPLRSARLESRPLFVAPPDGEGRPPRDEEARPPRTGGTRRRARAADATDEGSPASGTRRRKSGWLGLLLFAGLLLILAAVVLGGGAKDHHSGHTPQASGIGRPQEVGMPATLSGDAPVPRLRIVIALAGTLPRRAELRELNAFGSWLEGHANRRTRLTVVDPVGSTGSLPAGRWNTIRPHRQGGGTRAAVRVAFGRGRGTKVLVTFDRSVGAPTGQVARLKLTSKRGAPLPIPVLVRPGAVTDVELDSGTPGALAATIARGIITISNELEAGDRG